MCMYVVNSQLLLACMVRYYHIVLAQDYPALYRSCAHTPELDPIPSHTPY